MPAIRSTDIAKLRDEWLKTLKPATVLRRLQVLSHDFNIGRKECDMESLSNPLELVRKAATQQCARDGSPQPGLLMRYFHPHAKDLGKR